MVWIESDKVIVPGFTPGVSVASSVTLVGGEVRFIGRVSDEFYLRSRLADPAFYLLVRQLVDSVEQTGKLEQVKDVDFWGV